MPQANIPANVILTALPAHAILLHSKIYLQGGVQFPTGSYSLRAFGMNRCNSDTDGIVRMKEDQALRGMSSGRFFALRKEKIMETKRTSFNAKTLATIGMLCAIAFVAKLLSSVLPTVAGFLSFDLKDVVIVIGGFMLGPFAAAIITLVVSLVEMVTVSSTGLIGLVMNVLASCSFACTASVIYRKKHNLKGAVLGLALGVLFMTAVMLLWNWLITPLYMKVDRSVVVGMLLPVFLPFNLVKGGLNAALAMLLYKPVVTALRKAHLIEEHGTGKRETKWGVVIVSALLLVTFVLLALVLMGIL